jgi:hypothetical protein
MMNTNGGRSYYQETPSEQEITQSPQPLPLADNRRVNTEQSEEDFELRAKIRKKRIFESIFTDPSHTERKNVQKFRSGLTTDTNGKLIRVMPNSKPIKFDQMTTIIT